MALIILRVLFFHTSHGFVGAKLTELLRIQWLLRIQVSWKDPVLFKILGQSLWSTCSPSGLPSPTQEIRPRRLVHLKVPFPPTGISHLLLWDLRPFSPRLPPALFFSPNPHHQAPPGPECHQGYPGLHGVRRGPRPPGDHQVLPPPWLHGGKSGGTALGVAVIWARVYTKEVGVARGAKAYPQGITFRASAGLRCRGR